MDDRRCRIPEAAVAEAEVQRRADDHDEIGAGECCAARSGDE